MGRHFTDSAHFVPIGPMLGRLARPGQGLTTIGFALDDVRLELVDRLIESASRSGQAWVVVWRETATSLTDLVLGEATTTLSRAARISRMPAARLRALMPSGTEREILIERVAAQAIALEELAGQPESSGIIRSRGAALESAWDSSVELIRGERARWRAVAVEVEAWRRPWRPLILAGLVLVPLAALVAAWIGGWLNAPPWFRPVIDRFWRLPWP